jgi:hypothetical protein
VAAVALAAAGTFVSPLAAGPASAHTVARPATAGPGGTVSAAVPARSFLLINGDRLMALATPVGGLAISLLPGTPAGDSLVGLKTGSLAYEIPEDALPYLGRGLDPSLFELSALERAETRGRLPVQLTFEGRRPVLPGVLITHSAAGIAQGYLTASSARLFGAALARQFRADHARASYGTDGLFGGGVNIALAGTDAPVVKAARPDFLMHTLTVAGSGLSGRPDTGDLVSVYNADNAAEFFDPNESSNSFYDGTAKFSVPAGTYWAVGQFFTFTRNTVSLRLAILPQFTVGRNTTVHIAERAANSQVTMTVPRPSATQATNFEVIRGGLHGTAGSASWLNIGLTVWVSPTERKPTVGTLRSFTSGQLTSPANAAGASYAYDLDYAGPDGTIPAQHYVVRPASLATITERYYQDVRTTGTWDELGGVPLQLEGLIFALDLPLQLPGTQTQYLTPGLWTNSYTEFNPVNSFPWGGQGDDSFLTRSAGQHQIVEWNRYPLHPQPDVSPGGPGGRLSPLIPSAARSGNTLRLLITPFSDNQPGHLGAGFSAGPGATTSGSYQIDQNGVQIARGNPAKGISAVRLSPRPSLITFTLNAARTGRFPLSTSSQTVWTWRSVRQPVARLPQDWYCSYSVTRQQIELRRQCAVQPMMTLSYQVQGLTLNGSVPPGDQVIDLSAGHIQLAKASAITGATAEVSYNDGQTWRDATVTATGGGNFRIAFPAPGGVDVTLRVTATDSAGGSIKETILRAYAVSF